jgi:hypothetical protein
MGGLMQDSVYHTVFVVHPAVLRDLFPAWILSVFGAVVLYSSWRHPSQWNEASIPVARVTAPLLLLLAGVVGLGIRAQFHAAVVQYQRGDYALVSGPIAQFRPGSGEHHRDEAFVVGSQEFRYTASEISPYFHKVSGDGGPLHAGAQVRIGHRGGDIVLVQIAVPRTRS